jgi:putative ABC transport system permease protein
VLTGLDQQATEELYRPVTQAGTSRLLAVRTTADPLRISKELKEMIWSVDPDQPISNIETIEQKRSASMASPRLTAILLGMFALLALIITGTGVSSVIAFSVSQRTQEFGIRMALGAPAFAVLMMVLRQGMLLVIIGLGVGLAGSIVSGRVMTGLLFETRPTDPLTLAVVSTLLAGSAALACLIPARRATTVDPTVALRDD